MRRNTHATVYISSILHNDDEKTYLNMQSLRLTSKEK